MSRIFLDPRTTLVTPYARIIIALCILHIYSYCRSFASSSIVQFWRRRVKRPVNREKSFTNFPSASSSSLITACNPITVILTTLTYLLYKRRTLFLVECIWSKSRTCIHTILDLSIQPTFKNSKTLFVDLYIALVQRLCRTLNSVSLVLSMSFHKLMSAIP
jgi:hypothetical protein